MTTHDRIMTDWRLHAALSAMAALFAVADVAVDRPWVGLICAFASGLYAANGRRCWFDQKILQTHV
jgi:hypothetical protein